MWIRIKRPGKWVQNAQHVEYPAVTLRSPNDPPASYIVERPDLGCYTEQDNQCWGKIHDNF